MDSGWKGGKKDTNEATGPVEEKTEEPEEKRIKLDNKVQQEEDKQNKKRIRGQNKSRPHKKPQSYDDRRLCPSIIQVEPLKKKIA